MELVLVNTSGKALVLTEGLMGFVHRCLGVLSDALRVLAWGLDLGGFFCGGWGGFFVEDEEALKTYNKRGIWVVVGPVVEIDRTVVIPMWLPSRHVFLWKKGNEEGIYIEKTTKLGKVPFMKKNGETFFFNKEH